MISTDNQLVSRLRKNFSYQVLCEHSIKDNDGSIMNDQRIQIGWRSGIKVLARLIRYRDPVNGEQYDFISNNLKMKATSVANLYKKRWQIELLIQRMQLKYKFGVPS